MTSAASAPAGDVLGYKPFVDGLRAVSIIAVVAYHGGVPGVASGFIGVDVFFVISGFLIVNQIVAGLEAGRFTFAEFWARRALRILPPYLLVVAATLLAAPLVLVTPREFAELGREAQYSALMVVNYYFAASKGYFDVSGELKPLLHLWSLSVEEQFYVVAPLVLFALWWGARRLKQFGSTLWFIAIASTVTVSFAACIAGTAGGNDAFFLMPFRAWEFALGGLVPLAVAPMRRLGAAAATVAALAGIALIVAAACLLGDVAYPSFYAMLPVAGACLVILSGVAFPANPVARALSVRPVVWIGLLSYAWYLWHWPLLSFGAIHNFGDNPTAWRWGAILLSFCLAAATHHWLEIPIRNWRSRGRRRLGWRVAGAGAVAAIGVSLAGVAFVHVVAPAVERDLAARGLGVEADWSFLDRPCAVRGSGRLPHGCAEAIAGRAFGVLIGNSHARMLYSAIGEAAAVRGRELVAMVRIACIPFFPVAALEGVRLKEECSAFYSTGSRSIAALPVKPSFAVIAARWTARDELDGNMVVAPEVALAEAGMTGPLPAGLRPVMALGVAGFAAEARAWGVERTLLVAPVPIFVRSVPECIARADRRNLGRDVCSVARATIERERADAMVTLDYVASQFPDVRVVDPIAMFCDESLCRPYDDGGILYSDNDHLSVYGAGRLVDRHESDFAWAIGGEPAAPAPEALTRAVLAPKSR